MTESKVKPKKEEGENNPCEGCDGNFCIAEFGVECPGNE